MNVKFNASAADSLLMLAIADRYIALGGRRGKLGIVMSLEACHCNGCPLRLEALLAAPRDFDFIHDVCGIFKNIDHDSGELKNCFVPRYAARDGAAVAGGAC